MMPESGRGRSEKLRSGDIVLGHRMRQCGAVLPVCLHNIAADVPTNAVDV